MLRELLSLPNMTVTQRARYAELILHEYRDTVRTGLDDGLLAHMQKSAYGAAVESGAHPGRYFRAVTAARRTTAVTKGGGGP
jgi:hypothetical protein